jgi:hypothetical protein
MCLRSYQQVPTNRIGVGPSKGLRNITQIPHLLKVMLLSLLPGYQFERCHTSRHLILKRLEYSIAVISLKRACHTPSGCPLARAYLLGAQSAEEKARGGTHLAQDSR